MSFTLFDIHFELRRGMSYISELILSKDTRGELIHLYKGMHRLFRKFREKAVSLEDKGF